jgi:thiamine phosphate synthase YjbQ (UPF0047 family)
MWLKTTALGVNMEDNFEELYPRIREFYDKIVYEEGNNPMHVFGVFLGIIAQEFKENSTKEDFDVFMKKILEIEWIERTVN